MAKKQKILLYNYQSPGDIVMLTAAVRDLAKSKYGSRYEILVDTSCGEIWENNPYCRRSTLEQDPDARLIHAEYPLIHWSNQAPYHFIHGFRMHLEKELGHTIDCCDPNREVTFKGDIHLSEEEKNDLNWAKNKFGLEDGFWVMFAGGKTDFSAKWWDPKSYQKVVDYFQGAIDFAQVGEPSHWHNPLHGVTNLIGKTNLRELIRLIYHSSGVVCPVTFGMHAAMALPMKTTPPIHRPCVVIAGGREPAQWEAYPHHRFLSTNGALPCCDNGGCWKSRCQKIGDGDEKDYKDLCIYPTKVSDNLVIPKCMYMITPQDVIRAIEMYYDGGVLKYKGKPKKTFSEREPEIQVPKSQTIVGEKMSKPNFLFRPKNFNEARDMVVGPCNDYTMEERWELETPLFADVLTKYIHFTNATSVVDYGCGCGRVAKAILERNPQLENLYGIDASTEMLKSAEQYCNDSRFVPCKPKNTPIGKCGVVYSIYVIQHIPAIELRDALFRMHQAVSPEGVFINCSSMFRMAINFRDGSFFDDSILGVDLKSELERLFIPRGNLFSEANFARHDILRKMIRGEGGKLPHPAVVFTPKEVK